MSIETLLATCFSQDRKNQGNNYAYLRGQRVSPEDELRGREVINILSRVTSRVAPTRISDLVSVYIARGEIVVDARAQEEDVVGRRAGIVIHTKLVTAGARDFPNLVRGAALQFAEVAHLTLTERAEAQITEAVQIAQKKISRRWRRAPSRPFYVVSGALLLAVAILIVAHVMSSSEQGLREESGSTLTP